MLSIHPLLNVVDLWGNDKRVNRWEDSLRSRPSLKEHGHEGASVFFILFRATFNSIKLFRFLFLYHASLFELWNVCPSYRVGH